jgi:ribosomal protein L35AE/L33A
MNNIWQLQEAQTYFGKVIEAAERHGVQFINCQEEAKAVVLSIKSSQQLLKPKNTLVDFFQQSPLYGVSLDLERDSDTGREINLE